MLISCATTRLTAVQKNEDYKGGPIKKIAVLAVAKVPFIRNLFENDFVTALKARGVDAIPTYPVIPTVQLADRDLVVAKVKTLGTDAIIATRLLDRKTVETYVPQTYAVPSYYGDWGSYYGFVSTGYTVQEEFAYLETNVYDTKTGQLIWTARSETSLASKDESLIKSFIKVVVDRLTADRVIK
jgi:hypothetical protein